MMHLAAFSASIATGTPLLQIAAIVDQVLTVRGSDLVVPPMGKILWSWAGSANISRAQLQSPTLRKGTNPELLPLNISATMMQPPRFFDYENDPLSVAFNEGLQLWAAQGSGGAQQVTGLVEFCDMRPQDITGEFRTVRVSNTTTLVANAWTNGAISFDQNLEPGRYAMCGGRFKGAGLEAFRLNPPGGQVNYRPGGLGCNADSDFVPEKQRFGGWGKWMEFDFDQPPTVDFLSTSADTSQVGLWDLLYLGR